jgi:hypothetical protein
VDEDQWCDFDSDEYDTDIISCVCGSIEFWLKPPEGEPLSFNMDSWGDVAFTNGHPICMVCGIDYPILYEDPNTGEPVVLLSTDLISSFDEEE